MSNYFLKNKPSLRLSYPPELWLARGYFEGESVIKKFGHAELTASYTPVTHGNIYNMPQVSGATTLRIKAGGNAGDTSDGAGAREVTLEGLDETGAYVSETLATAGVSASSPTTTSFLRLFRVFVSASGTYADTSTFSHIAEIVFENSAGGTDWATIPILDIALSQGQIGCYSVPLGSTAFISSIGYSVDGNKTIDLALFKREGILDTAAPYSALRVIREEIGISGALDIELSNPLGPFPELTDLGFLAKGATTPSVSVDFTIILVAN